MKVSEIRAYMDRVFTELMEDKWRDSTRETRETFLKNYKKQHYNSLWKKIGTTLRDKIDPGNSPRLEYVVVNTMQEASRNNPRE